MQVEDGIEKLERLKLRAKFYLAEIQLDVNLSYPWMKRNKLRVFPDLESLALRDPFMLLLVEPNRKRRLVKKG